MDLPIDSLYGSAFARSHELGLHKNMFWATLDPATGSDWGTTMSDQLGGTRLGIPSELARGMSTSNDVRALKYDELLRKSFAVRPGDDLSRAVRARRLTELDVMGILMVVSLAIPDDTASSGFRRGHPFLTVVGAPCAAEKGQSVTAPSLWPDVGGRPARLLKHVLIQRTRHYVRICVGRKATHDRVRRRKDSLLPPLASGRMLAAALLGCYQAISSARRVFCILLQVRWFMIHVRMLCPGRRGYSTR